MFFEPRLISLTCFSDSRGNLSVIEGADLPFSIKRVYYLFDVPVGGVRGEHGHKSLQQLLICMNGACDATLHDGHKEYFFQLTKPAEALHIPPGMWRSLRFREPATTCCVLASDPYNQEDYLYAFEEYLAWVKENK